MKKYIVFLFCRIPIPICVRGWAEAKREAKKIEKETGRKVMDIIVDEK